MPEMLEKNLNTGLCALLISITYKANEAEKDQNRSVQIEEEINHLKAHEIFG